MGARVVAGEDGSNREGHDVLIRGHRAVLPRSRSGTNQRPFRVSNMQRWTWDEASPPDRQLLMKLGPVRRVCKSTDRRRDVQQQKRYQRTNIQNDQSCLLFMDPVLLETQEVARVLYMRPGVPQTARPETPAYDDVAFRKRTSDGVFCRRTTE